MSTDYTGNFAQNFARKYYGIKTPRPDIPKGIIIKIGSFDKFGNINNDWVFSGKGIPNAVGRYISEDWDLFGGYTVDELKQIANENELKV